jgi:predicted benzoate:H+ symporter BenE
VTVAFLITASGVVIGGLTSAPLGLLAGVVLYRLDIGAPRASRVDTGRESNVQRREVHDV